MLLDRKPAPPENPHQYILQLRHYAIATSTPKSSLPKALRRLETAESLRHNPSSHKHALPNLGKLSDVADYLLDTNSVSAGFTSASESEPDTDAEVEVLAPASRRVLSKDDRQKMRDAQRVRLAAAAATANGGGTDSPAPTERAARKAPTEKKAIKLQELGPRMTLRLTKVEEGLCGGKIMWHEYINKSVGEEKAQEKVWAQRNREKEERRKVQKENVERKRKERKAAGGKAKAEGEEDDDDEDEVMADWSDGDDVWDEIESEDEEGGAAIQEDDDEEEEE